jgi:YVTN family beta-propeller protein
LEVVATLPTGEGPHEVEVSPDGTRALVTNYGNREKPGNTLTLVNIGDQAVEATIALPANARPHGLQWLDDTTAVVTAEGIRSLLVVDVAARVVSKTFSVDQDVAHMVALSNDGARAFVANIGSGTVSVVDLASGSETRHIGSGKGTEGIAMVNEGRELWLTNRGDGTVTIFDAATLERIGSAVATGFPIRAETDDARKRVYISAPADDALLVIASDGREEVARIAFDDIGPDRERETMLGGALPDSSVPVGVQLSGDGEQLFVAHTNAHVVSVYDAESLVRQAIVEVGLEPDGMAWSPVQLP